MRVVRVFLHLVTMACIFYFCVFFLRVFNRTHEKPEWLCCAGLVLLFFVGCTGLILEYRRHRLAAWLNPALPLLFAVTMVAEEWLVAEPEALGFVLLFALIPVSVAAIQGVLYYMAWASDSLRE